MTYRADLCVKVKRRGVRDVCARAQLGDEVDGLVDKDQRERDGKRHKVEHD